MYRSGLNRGRGRARWAAGPPSEEERDDDDDDDESAEADRDAAIHWDSPSDVALP
jgi:hypothetical protein